MTRSVSTNLSPDEVWERITRATCQEHWWGTSLADLTHIGQHVVVETESDWHAVWVEEVRPRHRLNLNIATFGLDPLYGLALTIEHPVDDHAKTYIHADVTGLASPAASLAREDVWALRMTQAVSAVDALPAWYCPLVEAVQLETDTWAPLHPGNLQYWLPFSKSANGNRFFYTVDEEGPRPFTISRWHAHYDESLELDICCPHRSEAVVSINSMPAGIGLSVRHAGICPSRELPSEVALLLRQRFAASWSAALREASRIASKTSS